MIVPCPDSPRFLVTLAGATVSMLNSEQILALTHGQIVLYKHEPSDTSPGVTHFPVTVFLQLSHFLSSGFESLSLSFHILLELDT